MGTEIRLEVSEVGPTRPGWTSSPAACGRTAAAGRRFRHRPPGPPPPAGSKGIDAGVVGGLLVTMSQLGSDLPGFIAMIRGWLSRGASPDQQDQLIGLFADRHRPAHG